MLTTDWKEVQNEHYGIIKKKDKQSGKYKVNGKFYNSHAEIADDLDEPRSTITWWINNRSRRPKFFKFEKHGNTII